MSDPAAERDRVAGDDARAYRRGRVRAGWRTRRRDSIRQEIDRNRRGEYRIPTWVLALVLVAVVAAWAALIVLS